MTPTRRGLITGLVSFVAVAPAVIRSPGLLMPIKRVPVLSSAPKAAMYQWANFVLHIGDKVFEFGEPVDDEGW